MKRLILAAALLSSGCTRTMAEFVRTDPSFQEAERQAAPDVFLDRVPKAPYRSVGIIEVRSYSTLSAIVSEVSREGRKRGCELVVARELHQPRASAAWPRVRLASQQSSSHVDQPVRREFICGVYTAPAPT